MTKPGKDLKRTTNEPPRGKKIGEVNSSISVLAVRYNLTADEMIIELERLRTAGWCVFKRIPDNPHSKFKIVMLAQLEDSEPEASAPLSSAFARRVEAKYGTHQKTRESHDGGK